jgi:hypothetical protein
MSLKISSELSLPREAATWVISYLAKRGAGKTYCAAVQAEEMLKAGIPIVVVDGMGIWWGLRVSADGESPGLPIIVFGGEHADLPLVPEKSAEMAKAVVESNISCVLDLSGLSRYAARKIVMSFLNELYRLNRVERHVYIEESDMFAPQRPIGPEEALCLSAVDNFVRRGGNHNLGVTLITQRSAVLNKDILTQSDCLVILRTLAPQDKKAIQAWVEEQTDEDKKELNKWYDGLKSLENGEAWVWHPEEPPIFQRVMYRQRETFHATRKFILSPHANKITLMGVDEFVERFKKVFNMSQVLTYSAGLNPAVLKELEEYRSGNKLAPAVEQRLNALEAIKVGQENLIKKQTDDLATANAFRDAFGKFLFPHGIPSVRNATSDGGVPSKSAGLQHTQTIIDLPAVEKRVTINTDNIRGKVLAVAQKGKLDSWRKLDEIVKAVEEEHWSATPQEVNNALNDLEKQGLIAKKHTDRNYYCLAKDVVFEGKKEAE